MKYGQSLGAFSVPEWRNHNILYDELKHEVKDLTQSDATFSKTGYFALVDSFRDEYASVNLFVSCKISEIEYRFQQCDQSIRELARSSQNSTSAAASLSDDDEAFGEVTAELTSDPSHSRHEEKIAELKKDITKLTQDIQNLSRFITAQFTGFRKLIKKYRRHAPQEQLQKGRNLEEIDDLLVSKDSFAEVDLTPQFLELSVLYSVLRTRKFASYVKKPMQGSSIVDQLAEYDSKMVTSPSSDVYRFWIHPDNLMQVKVLLLQHMDLLAPPEVQQELAQRLDPNGNLKNLSHSSAWHPEIMPEEYTTALYMDTEELQSARNLKEPAQVREIMVGREHSKPFLLAPMGGTRHPAVMTLTRSQVRAIQEERHEDFRQSLKDQGNVGDGSGNVGAQLAVRWAFSHRVKPVVTLSMHRTRFRSSGSNSDSVWATIDSHATIVDDSLGHVSSKHVSSNHVSSSPSDRVVFPYSVLEVRTRTPSHWIDTLRQSHLVHPVSASFSLYGWALLTTRPQQVLVRPSWLNALDSGTDIRRNPQDHEPQLKTAKSMANLKLVGGRSGSHRLRNSVEEEVNPPAHRYWNEFDDGDEYQDNTEHFFDEIDAELQRAQVAARLAQPVYSIGDGVRRHWHQWFDRTSPTHRTLSDVEATGDATSFHSLDTQSTSSLEPLTVGGGSESGQYSPRVSNARRFSRRRSDQSATYGSCDYPFTKDEMQRQQSDPGLTFYTSVMFLSSTAIVLLVYYVLFTEEMSVISIGFRLFLVLALTVSLCLALAGYVINSFRSGSSWTSQVVVHAVLLTIVCFGVGGAANIAIPPV